MTPDVTRRVAYAATPSCAQTACEHAGHQRAGEARFELRQVAGVPYEVAITVRERCDRVLEERLVRRTQA